MFYDRDFDQQFELMWQQATSIPAWQDSHQLEVQQRPTEYCIHGQYFAAWCEKNLLTRARAQPSERLINEALYYLQQQYRARYSAVDRFHRQTVADFGDHLCLHAVWLQTASELDDLLFGVVPPKLYHVETKTVEKIVERVTEKPGYIYLGDAPLD